MYNFISVQNTPTNDILHLHVKTNVKMISIRREIFHFSLIDLIVSFHFFQSFLIFLLECLPSFESNYVDYFYSQITLLIYFKNRLMPMF